MEWYIAAASSAIRRIHTSLQNHGSRIEHQRSAIRSKTGYPFRVIKRWIGHTKVRYRELAKNTVQPKTLFARLNLWMTRQSLREFTG